jgi:hypothetical protein
VTVLRSKTARRGSLARSATAWHEDTAGSRDTARSHLAGVRKRDAHYSSRRGPCCGPRFADHIFGQQVPPGRGCFR